MRCLIQRVKYARVEVDKSVVGEISEGFLILLGVAPDDNESVCEQIAKKAVNLRVFNDDNGKMNISLLDKGLAALIVSQFTLYADCRKGNRPSYISACEPEKAQRLYECFCSAVEALGVRTERGIFGADMKLSLLNDGPVTVMLDSDEIIKKR